MSEEKNLELVIDIAVAVKQRAPKALFVIAGDGPLFPALRERVESSGASHAVHFTGFYPKVRELLAASDVFLLPSFLELHSIAILEALSAGVPVTASAGVGCNSDVLTHGRDVMLLDPFHKEDWVGPLADLVNDASLRRRIGQAGRDLCWSQFDIRKVAGHFEGLYEEMIHE